MTSYLKIGNGSLLQRFLIEVKVNHCGGFREDEHLHVARTDRADKLHEDHSDNIGGSNNFRNPKKRNEKEKGRIRRENETLSVLQIRLQSDVRRIWSYLAKIHILRLLIHKSYGEKRNGKVTTSIDHFFRFSIFFFLLPIHRVL